MTLASVSVTQEDYDQTKLSTDLAYSHMAMLTQLPNGSLASLMQVAPRAVGSRDSSSRPAWLPDSLSIICGF